MSISSLYNITFTVKRVSTANRIDTEATSSTGNAGLIRPISKKEDLFNVANWGKEFKLWCATSVDVQPNDVVVVGTTRYSVDNVNSYEDLNGNDSHLEVVIYNK